VREEIWIYKGGRVMEWSYRLQDIPYSPDDEIMIRTRIGVVSAWWCEEDEIWVCYDDAFTIYNGDVIAWCKMEVDNVHNRA